MTESDRNPPVVDDVATESPVGHGEAGAPDVDGSPRTPREAELEAQIAEMRDQALRAVAETDNVRKRAQREIEDTRRYAVSNFAKELLVVADNLRRALDMAPKEPDTAMTNFLVGVEATERQLQGALEKAGISRMEPMGKPADPNFHQIMMEVDGGDAPPGAVVQVLQDGYMIHDRLLRAALVGVAKRTAGAPVEGAQVNEQA